MGQSSLADLLALVETIEAGALNSADVDEHVLPAAVRLDEPETLGAVEPFDRASSHRLCPSCASKPLGRRCARDSRRQIREGS